ncbi:MAG: molybdenum ABC transporter ATP-binding protein [Acidobacteria bacterium]|nr:molybdenum ABC transporter ATP-binding protein [Acidobacteriota bacterium]
MIAVAVRKQVGTFLLDVAFTAPASGITALFGRSGAGKTTIISLIAGITAPDAGRIAIADQVFYDAGSRVGLPPEQRRVGVVFQDSRLFPHLSVEGNLRYGLRRAHAAGSPVAFDAVVDVLGVGHLLARRPQTLSGGERQRVALGRAWLAQPRLLLMDEPLASLDAPRKAEILSYIERLRDEFRLPMIYVSHSLDEVIRLADHLLVVSDGRIAASGPLAEVVSRLDLQPLLGRFEAGAVIDCTVEAHDDHYLLTTLHFDTGHLRVPLVDRLVGTRVRVRLRARDIGIAISEPRDLSITNRLAGTITGFAVRDGVFVDVTIAIGATTIRALVSRESRDRLGLAVGQRVWALIKTVALDNRSLGFLRPPRDMMKRS